MAAAIAGYCIATINLNNYLITLNNNLLVILPEYKLKIKA